LLQQTLPLQLLLALTPAAAAAGGAAGVTAGTEVQLHLQRQDVVAADGPHPHCAPLLLLLLLGQ
jgi:hypothetical protein